MYHSASLFDTLYWSVSDYQVRCAASHAGPGMPLSLGGPLLDEDSIVELTADVLKIILLVTVPSDKYNYDYITDKTMHTVLIPETYE